MEECDADDAEELAGSLAESMLDLGARLQESNGGAAEV